MIRDDAAFAFGVALPCNSSVRAGSASDGRGRDIAPNDPHQDILDLIRRLARCELMRLPILRICVSTAMVGMPKAMDITTFAVLRPTPGSVTSSSPDAGDFTSEVVDELLLSAMNFFPLLR